MAVNMSHCRFHNTVEALKECDAALEEIADSGADWGDLSEAEHQKALELLRLVRRMDGDWGDFIDD